MVDIKQIISEARRGRPRKNAAPSSGEDEGGREHIVVQLRKAENLRGEKHIEFNDSSKHKIPLEHVKKALNMHRDLKPIPKGEFEKRLAHSHSSFMSAVKGEKAPASKPKVSLGSMKREDVDPTTLRSDRGELKPTIITGADGKLKVVMRKSQRKEIKVEAVSVNMQQDSLNKLKKEPQASPKDLKTLPPTQGNKPVGGEDQTHVGKFSVAEQQLLNNLYNVLSEENKKRFDELSLTDEGISQLLSFAKSQEIE